MSTIADTTMLLATATGVIHWLWRGGRWQYLPESGIGWVVFLFVASVALIPFPLASRNLIGYDQVVAAVTIAALLDLSYCCWRRERGQRERPLRGDLPPPSRLAVILGVQLWAWPASIVLTEIARKTMEPAPPIWAMAINQVSIWILLVPMFALFFVSEYRRTSNGA